MYRFADQPAQADYQSLATHLNNAQQPALHPELWPQRTQVAERLHQMAQQPQRPEHLSAYQALRLFVW